MLWPVWVVLVLVGTLWSYFAFVAKAAPIWSGLMTVGFWTVAGFGAFAIEMPDGAGGTIVATETAAAILAFTVSAAGVLVTLAAATGQYGAPDLEDQPDAGRLDLSQE